MILTARKLKTFKKREKNKENQPSDKSEIVKLILVTPVFQRKKCRF